MMGSPQFLAKIAATVICTMTAAMYLESEKGRKSFIEYNHPGEHKPGKDGRGFYAKKMDVKGHYNELEMLRKVKVTKEISPAKEIPPSDGETR